MASTAGFDGAVVDAWLRRAHADLAAREDDLTELDVAIGDGDHGFNMVRGFAAVEAALDDAGVDQTPAALLALAARAFRAEVGGASGSLWSAALAHASACLPDEAAIGPDELASAFEAARFGIVEIGAAEPGDKTMIDALCPATDALRGAVRRGAPLTTALTEATAAAERGAQSTAPMRARKGRAAYLGERSVGHQDPGATSVAVVLGALASTLVDATA